MTSLPRALSPLRHAHYRLLALSLAFSSPAAFAQKEEMPQARASSMQEISKLIAAIRPVGDSKVRGTVVFDAVEGGVKVTAKIGGLMPNSKHGFHIHQYGDLGSEDASSAGGHFNPEGHPHAMPDKDERHAGDLGNLEADSSGDATLELTVKNLKLAPGPDGILGRAVIVHAKPDDGTQPSGNSGDRIGAGVIGLSKDAMEKDTPAGSASKDTEAAEPDSTADGPVEEQE